MKQMERTKALKTMVSHLVAVAAAIILATPLLLGQMNVGNIVGTITDPTGAVVPSAKLLLVNEATQVSQETQTNSSGSYFFRALPVGRYSLSVTLSGFQTYHRKDIPVVSGETVTLDVGLVVGSESQTISVTGEAPLLDTATANSGTTRTEGEIEALPITLYGNSSRAASALAKTMAGVSYEPAESGGQEFMIISRAAINGVPSGKWSYNIDGVDAGLGSAERGHDMIAPSPEIIQEVRLTANNDVSEGFSPGVTLNLTEKSGTNAFHGSLYYYMRNDAFGARSFFLAKVPQDIQNNGGFSLGGPVIIPKVYNGKNKTFFFVNLDIYRFRTDLAGVQQAATGSVATALMRQGNFSELLGPQIGTDALGRPVSRGQIYDPRTNRTLPGGQIVRDPFPGNIITDPARLSSASKFFLNAIALPTQPGTALNWTGPNAQTRVDKDQLFLKFDHAINPTNRLTYAYERLVPWLLFQDQGITTGFSGHSFIAGGPGFLGPEVSAAFIDDRDQYRHRFNYVWTPKPSLLLNFRAGLTRTPHRLLSWFPVNGPNATAGRDAGLKGTLDPRQPLVNIEGFSQFGSTFASFVTPAQNVPVNIDLAWTKGQHNFKFGVNYLNMHTKVINQNNGWGTFTFRDRETGLPGFAGTGSGMASFLLGEVDNLNVGSPFDSWVASGAIGFFGQDSWRVTPKLTLTYGLRWDLFFPTTEHNDKVGSFDPNLPNPAAGGRLGGLSVWGTGPGRNGISRLNDYYYGALGGQLGIAYSLDSKTVLRMNYGVGYASGWDKWTGGLTPQLPQPGFSASFTPSTVDEGVTPAFNWNDTIPVTFPPFPVTNPSLLNGGTLGFINRADNKPPMYQNIGFEIGRELPGQLALRVSYLGTLVHRIPANGAENLNALPLSALSLGNLLLANINSPQAQAAGIAVPFPGFNGSVAQALLPYPQYISVPVLEAQVGNSSYHALQINAQKRFGSGLSFLVAYTASKNLTNSFLAINGTGNMVIQHPSQKDTGKSIDNADRPQQLAVSWTYELPFGKGKAIGGQASGVVNQLIGGWKVSGIQNYFAGRPIRVTSRATIPFANAIWPNRVPDQPLGVTSCGDYDPGDPARNRYLNSNAFATPAPFTFGNISQLPNIRVCGYMEENFGIDKEFPIREGTTIRFGSLFQNAFNRVNWRTLNTDTGNTASFGKYQDSYPGRNIQFYLRVDF
jgi:hypothetical protein